CASAPAWVPPVCSNGFDSEQKIRIQIFITKTHRAQSFTNKDGLFGFFVHLSVLCDLVVMPFYSLLLCGHA
ncbi:MAG TPA: hypothetical protein VFW00_04960, partial [Rhodocyclaceae bacterium]|nr:hypothetical protein [Rhodocyclaceae bacterium]